ncbi:hypothetical protein [Hornefia butyriciproducens]|uniref:PD-(D/E)XK endonuclease-like domain-containing protein n=1 Tax=Hornefia butyriciproducens TaxID=2652293 RepID=A0A6L5Y7U1_9FIRM|nr:hypothetical protein [Hornefia butyriciproducens]MST52784.1 hypothetical protein [Hornefia butyriciproducens]
MSIVIYTYKDPYRMESEPYWNEIKTCPYFCVSQTLANGLKYVYKSDFQQGRVTTVQNLIEALYEYWTSTACAVKQHTDIDNIISHNISTLLNGSLQLNMASAFLFNREDIFESLRIMFELNINLQDVVEEKLTPEQRFIVEIYRIISNSGVISDFTIDEKHSIEEIDKSISSAMAKAAEYAGNEIDLSKIQSDRIVIHGVHQFSPIMLRAIEKIAESKRVILLFNYQPQYKNAYQTWIDIYSTFDCPIVEFDGAEFRPNMEYPVSFQGNLLADNLGKLINGDIDSLNFGNSFEITEFDNTTEFANYVADIFAKAEKTDSMNPMGNMSEQIYAADSSANNILKIYFPEQFGERQFLNYPLGHFFIAVANMWDSAKNELVITDINDIKECLDAGILKENHLGQLSSIFESVAALFEGCTSIDGMTSRIRRVRKNKKHLTDPTKKEYVSHISYYTVSNDDLDLLESALQDLDELSAYFYEDFEKRPHNFKEFYKKLKRYLQDDVLIGRDLGEEFSDIIRRVLVRLEEVESIDASASFECLKATMSIYLVQETKPGKSANWIIRNFEQIDGDIIRSLAENKNTVYHFACLTDEDIDSVNRSNFPWPLDGDFFEVAQEPVDWKYQAFVRSRKEYKNFKRYALLYGLEFNRAKFKLSYVKRDGDKEREPYYLLKTLGAKRVKHEDKKTGKYLESLPEISVSLKSLGKFDEYDYYRFKICKYRFLLESLIENTTVYRDDFLLMKYLEVLLENQVKEELQGVPISETILIEKLNEAFDELKRYFPYVQNVNRMDAISNIRSRIINGKQKSFPILKNEERKYMMIRELFIHKQLSDPRTFRKNILADKFPDVSEEKLKEVFSEDSLKKNGYSKEPDLWCQYCANHEYCAAYYAETN